jgi:hypothetical protein
MPVTVNISGLDGIRLMLDSIDMNALCLEIANSLKSEIKHRIHEEGKAADGSEIGTYSKGYIKVRTGNYDDIKRKNGDYYSGGAKYKRGAKKGDFKEKKSQEKSEAGVFSRGPRKGQPRPVYNRKNENGVILSLTRQMEKDMDATNPIPIEGGYGIGFTNDFNYDKSQWNDKRYGKTVYDLTEKEEQLMNDIIDRYMGERMQ